MQHCHTPKCKKCSAIVPDEFKEDHKLICDTRVNDWIAGHQRSSNVEPVPEEDRPVVISLSRAQFNEDQKRRLKRAGHL